MPYYELSLKDFLFPKALPGKNANFRFVVDLRFVNEKNQPTMEHAVMPSLDTFWECDKDNCNEPNYVRCSQDHSAGDRNVYNSFDMDKIDNWEKLILLVNGTSLHSIQFKVFDVNRPDRWDSVRNFLDGLIKVAGDNIKDIAPGTSGAWGKAAGDVISSVVKKLAGGGDTVLFRGSAQLYNLKGSNPPSVKPEINGEYKFVNGVDGKNPTIKGDGAHGKYQIFFSVIEMQKMP